MQSLVGCGPRRGWICATSMILLRGMLLAAEHPNLSARSSFWVVSIALGPRWGKRSPALGVRAKPLRLPIPLLFLAAALTHLLAPLDLRKPFEFNLWRAVDFSQPNWTFSSEKAQRILGYTRKSLSEKEARSAPWIGCVRPNGSRPPNRKTSCVRIRAG